MEGLARNTIGEIDTDVVEMLLAELSEERSDAEGVDPTFDLWGGEDEQPMQALMTTLMNSLFPHTDFRFDEGLVKNNLDELLLLLIAVRSEETHGKALMEDLTEFFGARLSPGTVYPQLHKLEEDGLLQKHEKVRTKEYRIADSEAVERTLQRTMWQHLAIGYALYLGLNDIDSEDSAASELAAESEERVRQHIQQQ